MNKKTNGDVAKPGGEIAPATLPLVDGVVSQRLRLANKQYQVACVRDWYTKYFMQVFRTFTRELVGKRISPGDETMRTALDLLPTGARELPPGERVKCFLPLEVLLRAIADAWEDAAAPALSAAYHWCEVENFFVHEYGDGKKPMPVSEAQAKIDEVNGHIAATKADLNKLSAQLLKATPDELKQTLEDIKGAIASQTDTLNEIRTAANLAAENAMAAEKAAEQATKGIDEIKDKMLALWWRWLHDKSGKPERARAIPPAEQKICGAMNDAAFGYWKAFQKGKLDGRLSAKKYDNYIVERRHKRSAKEFLQTHSKDVVWTAHDGRQYTLQELCPTVEDVQRMIDRNNKAIKRAKEKNGRLADKKKF